MCCCSTPAAWEHSDGGHHYGCSEQAHMHRVHASGGTTREPNLPALASGAGAQNSTLFTSSTAPSSYTSAKTACACCR